MTLRNCECGCGKAVSERTDRKLRRFAHGHNRRRSVLVYCQGRLTPVYIHDGRGFCTSCKSWVDVIW